MQEFNFNDLFVLDLANNHQGSVDHGLKVIRECGKMVRKHNLRAAMKFQFRQLDTLIHPSHQKDSDNKHIPRFLSTQLSQRDWKTLFDAVREEGMYTMCTPFDDDSVPVITDMGFDIIKVASCSSKDWPLLEKVAGTYMPVIVSTGGLEISDIDNLNSFFQHKGVDFALMHCVSIYPITKEHFNLDFIDTLVKRYRDQVIGWSTHEKPDDMVPVQLAVAKGAKIFERHVGYETDKIKLNAYSSTPEQLDKWFEAYRYAVDLCGNKERPITDFERDSLKTLERGVYLKKDVKKNMSLTRDDVYFAMPLNEGQITSEKWGEGITVKKVLKKDAPILLNDVELKPKSDKKVLIDAIHEVKAMLSKASIAMNSEFNVEFSHHYGVKNFREVGALIVDCINREYCKKLIVVLPGQRHPAHYHKRKEESFQVLDGIFECEIDGHRRTLHPGEVALVQPGVWHKFWSDTGCVIEEVSTTHYNNDSVYNDRRINMLKRSERKTIVEHWGRFEILTEESQEQKLANAKQNTKSTAELDREINRKVEALA